MSLHTQVLTIFQILCLCPPSPAQCCQLVLVSTCWPGAGDTQRPVPGQRHVSWVQCTWASPVHSATALVSLQSRHSILSKTIYCSLLENIITNLGKSFLVFCSKSERLSETCGDIREPKSLKIEIDLVFLLLSKILFLLTKNANYQNIDTPEYCCYWLHFESCFAKIYTCHSLANVGNKCSNGDNYHYF